MLTTRLLNRPIPRPARATLLAILLGALGSPLAGLAQEAADDDPALESYFVANGAYNRKLYPVAVTQYEAFLAEHPGHAKADLARQGLALSQYALKQYEKALSPLEALLAKEALDPTISRERLIMLKGQCLLLTGKRDDARALFIGSIDELKTDAYRAGALAAICDVSFGMSAWEEVLAWSGKLLEAKATAEQQARALYQQGYAHYQRKDAEAALASLKQIDGLEANPLWKTRAAYLLGECHNLQKDYEQAEAAFVAALPGLEGADAAECRYRLGLTRFVLEKHAECVDDLAAFLKAAPEDPKAAEARLYIARAQLELERYEEAEDLLGKMAKGGGPVAARATRWLARLQTRRSGDYDQAAALLAEAVAASPDSPIIAELKFDLANALMAKKEPDWKAALALLQELEADGEFSLATSGPIAHT